MESASGVKAVIRGKPAWSAGEFVIHHAFTQTNERPSMSDSERTTLGVWLSDPCFFLTVPSTMSSNASSRVVPLPW